MIPPPEEEGLTVEPTNHSAGGQSWWLVIWQRLNRRGRFYLVTMVMLIVIGNQVTTILNDSMWFSTAREASHQGLTHKPFQRPADDIVVVLIGNDLKYGLENRGASPLSPLLIAALLNRAVAAGTPCVVLDFDMRYPDFYNRALQGDAFAAEVWALKGAIRTAARNTKIVVPGMLRADGIGLEPSYLEELVTHPPTNVSVGLINLPADRRYLALGAIIESGRIIEGLGLAIARAKRSLDPNAALLPSQHAQPPMVGFHRDIPTVSGSWLLTASPSATRDKLNGRCAVIGGNWRTPTRYDAKVEDVYDTPGRPLPGVMVHAIYAEAVLNDELYWPASPRVVLVIKIVVLLVVAIAMATLQSLRLKVACLAAAIAMQVLFSYVAFANFGQSVDLAIPLILILVHAVIDRIHSGRHRLDPERTSYAEAS